jgi:hypothetical protein
MYTALFDQKEIQQLLVKKGADETLRDHSGNSVKNLSDLNPGSDIK